MHRFFCPHLSDPPATTATLDTQESHHARRVLRLEVGDEMTLFDGQGRIARGRLAAWAAGGDADPSRGRGRGRGPGRGQPQRDQLAVVTIQDVTTTPLPHPTIDVAVAIPKGSHADEMIAALSQLGVNRVIPLRAARAVVDPGQGKLDRFNRAAIESAKQCGRSYLMTVAPPATLGEALGLDHDLRLLAAPETPISRSAICNPPSAISAATRVLILIGPEGGWSPDELAAAASAGCTPWSLGPHILRIETAATAAAAIAAYLAWR